MGRIKKGQTQRPDLPSLKGYDMLCVDLETKDDGIAQGLGAGGVFGMGRVLGVAVATKDFEVYLPISHPHSHNYTLKQVQNWAKRELCRDQLIVGANIAYDLEWLRADGIPFTGPFADVQHAEPLINENARTYSLDALGDKYLPKSKRKLKDDMHVKALHWLKENGLEGVKFKDVREILWMLPAELVGPYAERDARATLDVYRKQRTKLKKEALLEVFDVECRLVPLIQDMRFRGVRIGPRKLAAVDKLVSKEVSDAWRRLRKSGGKDLKSVNSSKQIAPIFDALGLEYPRTEKTNAPSFTADFLEAHEHQVAKDILSVRRLEKTQSTFVDGAIRGHLHANRIHATIHQLRSDKNGTVSGRLSKSRPNLQQVPSSDDEGKAGKILRSLFVPEPGQIWWKIDWSQIEYRFIVHFANLMKLPKAHLAAQAYHDSTETDFHSFVAELCGIDRRPAKAINFGLSYCMGKTTLAKQLGLSRVESDALFGTYHAEVPFVGQLERACRKTAQERGYIRTILGRRRRFDLWESKDWDTARAGGPALPEDEARDKWGPAIRRAYVYKALNALIQGSAADLMKLAMVRAYESGVFEVIGTPTLCVHDELDGSMPNTRAAKDGLRELKHIMETCLPLSVPVIAEASTGPDWWTQKAFE